MGRAGTFQSENVFCCRHLSSKGQVSTRRRDEGEILPVKVSPPSAHVRTCHSHRLSPLWVGTMLLLISSAMHLSNSYYLIPAACQALDVPWHGVVVECIIYWEKWTPDNQKMFALSGKILKDKRICRGLSLEKDFEEWGISTVQSEEGALLSNHRPSAKAKAVKGLGKIK